MGITVFQIIAIVFFVLAFVFLALTVAVFFTQDIVSVIGYFTGSTAKKQTEQIRNQTINKSYGSNSKNKNNKAFEDLISKSSSSVNVSSETASNSRGKAHASKNLARKEKGVVDAPVINAQKAVADGGTVSLDSIESAVEIDTKTDVLENKNTNVSEDDVATSVLSSDEVQTSVLSTDDVQTTILSDDGVPTDVLDGNEPPTDVLDESESPTDLLDENKTPTSSLDESELSEKGTTVLNDEEVGTTVLSSEAVSMPEGFEILEDTSFADTNEVIE